MSDLEELTDEERMMNLLEELQRENERLKAQQQPLEPLLQTIRQQEQEITRLNSSLIGERQQNEKLLELAKSEKQLHEQNEKLRSENANLRQSVQNANSKTANLQSQLEKAMTIHLPDESLLQRFTAALKGADSRARDIILVHYINLAVVAVFVVMACACGYFSYSAKTAAEQAHTAIQNGIYDKDGWSMVPGAYSNEYTTATQRPEWYASFKLKNPERAHY